MDKSEKLSWEFPEIQSDNHFHTFQMKMQQQTNQESQSKEYFEKMEKISCDTVKKLEQKLAESNIRKKKYFSQSFQKTIISKFGNAYLFTISVGYFETEIYFLQINIDAACLERQPYSAGSYSSIFLQQFENKLYIIKSQRISSYSINNFDDKFDRILQEYFSNKIASILEFGPKIQQIFGFDIVCFNNVIEFSMEFCSQEFILNKNMKQKYESDLLNGMKIMHSLQIVHRDIKPKNISWSPTFQKWVFLDYGFVSFLKQKPGNRTKTCFRGTYQYTSKEVKNLYHLKNFGFVDLYDNDFQGLKLAKAVSFEHPVRLIRPTAFFLFQFLIHLSRMKKYIIQHDYSSIENYFKQKKELRNEFIGLLLVQKERKKRKKVYQQREIAIIYEKLKHNSFDQMNSETKPKSQQALKNISKIEEKDRKKYFQFFVKEKQSHSSTFTFLKESELKNFVTKRWDSFQFQKDLFIFFQQTLYGDSQISWKRMKILTDILIEFLIPKCQQKSWLWKFHRLINFFEEKFLQKKQFVYMKQIMFFYYFFNDRIGWKRINKILSQNQFENKTFNLHFQLYNDIASFISTNAVQKFLINVKQSINQSINQQQSQTLKFQVEQISSSFLNMISCKQPKKMSQFSKLLNSMTKQQIQIMLFEQLIYNLELENNTIFVLQKKQKEKKSPQNFSYNKYFTLHQIIQKLNELIENSSNILEPYFKAYPICQQIPHWTTFSYFFKKRNFQKLESLAKDIFQFNKGSLEEIIDELHYFLIRFNKSTQIKKQREMYLRSFNSSYKQKLSECNSIYIEKYWNFYFKCLQSKDFFEDNEKLKEQTISSLSNIINYFRHQELLPSEQIYINLLISLKAFHEGNPVSASQFLENLEKTSLIDDLKEDLLISFLHTFTFYEHLAQIFNFQTTSLCYQISQGNRINWLFLHENLFFWNKIIHKTKQNKQFEAISIISSYTSYLTNIQKTKQIQYAIFQDFIQHSTAKQLQTILIFFLGEKLKTIRQNNYLSSFILLVYLWIEQKIKLKLNQREIKRIYILSVISIDNFPSSQKIYLRKVLKYRFRFLEQKLKERKRRILNRQDDYGREKIYLFKKEFKKKFETKNLFCGKFKKKFESRIIKVEKNLRQSLNFL